MNDSKDSRANLLTEQGDTCYATGDFSSAVLNYTEAIQLNPTQASLYKRRADARLAMGESRSVVIADYTQAISQDPNYAEAYYRRGSERAAIGQLPDSLVDYMRAVLLDPKYIPASNSQVSSYAQAIVDYSQSLQKEPELPMVYFWRGIAQYALGKFSEAIVDLTEAIKLNIEGQEAFYFARGLSFEGKRERAAALADYDAALRINPEFEAARSQRTALHSI
jgi:tetratricopeptide (TPR) repeat protein